MKRALISVSDKRGIVAFASKLIEHGYQILSTGGTLRALNDAGVDAVKVDKHTGFPEILEGRVKTLHPKIHGGLLARRANKEDMETLKHHAIEPIDMVVVNLYPFAETIAKEGVSEEEAIEQIDIGGPSMLRSAAKNFASVTVLIDPNDYNLVAESLANHGDTSHGLRKELAVKVFKETARYDAMIAEYFSSETLFKETYTQSTTLRYGENPHQEAVLYESTVPDEYSLFKARQLNGKALSYNNIQDANAALNILAEYTKPTAVAVKHMNPCGLASGVSISQAYTKAYESDPVSIFGGIVALNEGVDLALARKLNETFLEIIVAPHFSKEALGALKEKKNLRLLELDTTKKSSTQKQVVSVNGGLLVQDLDQFSVKAEDLEIVTKRVPTDKEREALLFSYRAVKHVKSNAIVLAKDEQVVGVGAGQMNRVGAAHIACEQAKALGFVQDLVLASDAFFPFNDVVKLAARYGVRAIIQPGGSVRDQESIDLCDALDIAMVFTRKRHFKH